MRGWEIDKGHRERKRWVGEKGDGETGCITRWEPRLRGASKPPKTHEGGSGGGRRGERPPAIFSNFLLKWSVFASSSSRLRHIGGYPVSVVVPHRIMNYKHFIAWPEVPQEYNITICSKYNMPNLPNLTYK